MDCLYCDSQEVIIHMIRKNNYTSKKVYSCKQCGKFFSDNQYFKRMRYPKETILFALNLYCSGFSLSKIKSKLESEKNIFVNRSTVYRWVEKYSRIKV